MEQEDKWTQFAATGRIQDYLDYRRMENRSDNGGNHFHPGGESGSGDYSQKQQETNKLVW